MIYGTDPAFARCLEAVKRSYWPEGDFIAKGSKLPDWGTPPAESEQIAAINKAVDIIAHEVADLPYYEVCDNQPSSPISHWLPYLDHFHKLFLVRQWNAPDRDPRDQAHNLFRLNKAQSKGRQDNYSKNDGNFNHFVNVVAATARFIKHFTEPRHVAELFGSHIGVFGTSDAAEDLFRSLAYIADKGLRAFKLMLAAYYHDIGKAVVDERHAMEGYLLLTSHTSRACDALNAIAASHRLFPQSSDLFTRDDLLNVADFVRNHDIFGTLSTGEAGYTKLCEVVVGATRAGLRHSKQDTFTARSRRALFDLWLLNCADIMVSIKDKWALQTDLFDTASAQVRIKDFLGGTTARSLTKAGRLVHDLLVGYKILHKVTHTRHSFGSAGFEEFSIDTARAHAGERLRRLVLSAIPDPTDADSPTYKRLHQHIQAMSEESQTSAVLRSVECVAPVNEFADRFARIGHLDYALSFFRQIAEVAAIGVTEEIDGAPAVRLDVGPANPFRTGWIRDRVDELSKSKDETYFAIQARHFFDNYVCVVTEIISHVLFREGALKGILNVEFSDASNRLRQSDRTRKRELAAFDGPNRYRQAIHAILETIFLY